MLVGVGHNPNIGATLIVEFGTEDIDAADLANRVVRDGKPVETLSVHEVGGTAVALQRGRAAFDSLNEAAADARHESTDADELVVGVRCDGSDATPDIAASPTVSNAYNCLVAAGGTASFGEAPEFTGVGHVLTEQCVDEGTHRRLLDRAERREAIANLIGIDLRGAQPSPGNQGGGLTTIEKRSLKAISKGGTTPVHGIVDYAEHLPVGGGLVLMDTPGYDVENVVGKVAGDAQIIVSTTRRGSTTGNPVTPVVKVTGNPRTWERMWSNMGVNAGVVVEDDATTPEAGEHIFDEMLAVVDGKRTGAETRRMEKFAVTEVHPRELAGVRGR